MLLRYQDPSSPLSLVFDDDGRVAYAYLLVHDSVCADVWLYNRAAAPLEPPWADPAQEGPYLNPATHAALPTFELPQEETDIRVIWRTGSQGTRQAAILCRGTAIALLQPGEKPGWSRLATQDGPLAKRAGAAEAQDELR